MTNIRPATLRPVNCNNRLRFYWPIALMLLVSVGCATTSHQKAPGTVQKPNVAQASDKATQAQMAQSTVTNAINALRQNNEAAFKQHLCTSILSDYKTQFFDMWVTEVAKTENLVVDGVRFDPISRDEASVKIGFTVSGQRQNVAVRVVREHGVWKWAER